MNKKVAIVMITMFVLIVAVIAVVVNLILNNGKNNTSYNEITMQQELAIERSLNSVGNTSYVDNSKQINYQEENRLYPENIDKAFEGYNGNVSIYKLEVVLYNLVIDNSYRIYLDTKDLNEDKIKAYYYNNFDKYKDLNIKSGDAFVSIVTDFNSAFEKPNKDYSHSFVDVTTIKDVDTAREYVIVIVTKGGAYIKIKVTMSNTSSEFLFESYKEVEKIFETYKGPVTQEEVVKKIDNFTQEEAQSVFNDTHRKTNNEVMQLYDTDTANLNAMGIYSKEDLLAIARQTIYVRWDYKPETFMRYELGSGTLVENGAYTKYLLRLIYSDGGEITLELSLANNANATQKMKLSAYLNEEDLNDELDTSIEVVE